MIHLTFTGYNAGRPLCNVNKQEALTKGDEFYHYIFWLDLEDPRLCPECKRVANEEDEEQGINS